MTKLPNIIKSYIESHFSGPVGLIGCRTAEQGFAFDCCEFDLAVFSEKVCKNKLLTIGNYMIEVINLPFNSRSNIITLNNMFLVKGFTSNYPLTAIRLPTVSNLQINETDYTRALLIRGKRKILESLFYFDKIDRALRVNLVLASMWLKLSAYDYLEGVISLSGQRPMPLHELQQIRKTVFGDQIVSNGIQAALTCIGIERANRSTISRSLSALQNICANEYDKDLVFGKISSLEKVGMLPDCYYFIGKMAKRQLLKKGEKFHNTYSKLVQIALDLGLDMQQNLRLQRELLAAAKNTLRCYRKISVA